MNNDTYKIAELYNEQVSSYVDSYIQNKSKTTTPYNYTPLPVSSAPPVNAMPHTSTTSVPLTPLLPICDLPSPIFRKPRIPALAAPLMAQHILFAQSFNRDDRIAHGC